MARTRYQKGSLFKVKRKDEVVWCYRWREYTPEGQIVQHVKVIGSLSRIPSRTAAWKEMEQLHLPVNNWSADTSRPRTFSELAAHYAASELQDEKDPRDGRLANSTKDTYRYYLRKWILPEWAIVIRVRCEASRSRIGCLVWKRNRAGNSRPLPWPRSGMSCITFTSTPFATAG